MELAAAQGLEVRVVPLPAGLDPADAVDGFESRLGAAESFVHYRVRLELERAADRQEAFVRTREILGRFEDSPERQEALRLVADRLDLPRDTLAGFAPSGSAARRVETVSPKLVEAGDRLERSALAGCVAHPELRRILAELGPEHFDAELHRRLRAHLLDGDPAEGDVVVLLAELDARAGEEGIDEETAEQLLLRLRERRLRRELDAEPDPARAIELQGALQRLHSAFEELAAAQGRR
jgi:hypothetical protein